MSENNNASESGTVVEPAVAVKVEEPAITETIPPRSQHKPAARRGSAVSVLFNVLLLIAAAALGYGYWQQQQELDSLSAQQAAFSDQLASSGGRFASLQNSQQQIDTGLERMDSGLQTIQQQIDTSRADMDSDLQAIQQQLQQTVTQQEQNLQRAQQQLQDQLAESNSRVAALAAQFNTATSQLAAIRQQVSELGNRTADNVMLSEAAALVELAQQRLLAARNVQSAATLLAGSDDLLARVESIDITAARTILAADLERLRALPAVNVAALYEQLRAAISQVNSMSVVSGSGNAAFTVQQSAATEAEPSGWLDSALSVLDDYFVVTRQDVEITPLFTEEQQFLLRQNIELQLTSAQVALLNAEPEVFRIALGAAIDGVNQWLQSADDSKATVLATLTRLRETPIVIDMPDISASLNAIRQIPILTPAPAASEVVP